MAHLLREADRLGGHVCRDDRDPGGASAMRRFARIDEGQSTVELALVLAPLLLVIVFGLIELAGLMSDAMTMSAASREGARYGGALVNGGGTLGCSAGQSPNAATVDPNIVAAVERVLTGAGTRIALTDVAQIRVWKATATGGETAGQVNLWTYQAGGGPMIDGRALGFLGLVADIAWYQLNLARVQRAADAGALAGVVYLPGNVSGAVTAAKNESMKNGFQDGVAGVSVTAAPDVNNDRILRVDVAGP